MTLQRLDLSALAHEVGYPHDGVEVSAVTGKIHNIFLGHRDSTCDLCDFEFGNRRKHPLDEGLEGVVVILCDGTRMRLIG